MSEVNQDKLEFTPEEIDKIESYKRAIEADKTNAETYFDFGEFFLYEIKDYDKAIEQYQSALKYNPTHFLALHSITKAYKQKGEIDKAIECYKQAIEIDKTNAETYFAFGEFFQYEIENYDKAIEQYQSALKYNPTHFPALQSITEAYKQKGEIGKAIEYYKQAIETDKTNAGSYFAFGEFFRNEIKDYDKAIEQYQSALKYDPAHLPALQSIAEAYKQKGEIDKAIEYYKQAIETDKTNAGSYFAFGEFFLNEIKNYDKAIEQYQSALKYNPTHFSALHSITKAYKQKGEINKAIEYYRQAIEMDKANASMYIEFGNIFFDKKDYKKAIEQYELALKYDPTNLGAFINLSLAYTNLKDFDKALEYCGRALRINDSDVEAIISIAGVYEHAQKIPEAIQLYLRLIELYPDSWEAHTGLGLFYQRLYDFDKASDELLKSLEIVAETDSDNKRRLAEAYYNFGNLYLEKLNYVEALIYYNNALKTDSLYLYAQHNKAWVYQKLGQFKTAKQEWNNAVTIYDNAISTKDLTAEEYFYYAEVLNYYIEETDPRSDPIKIESYYKESIKRDPAAVSFRLSFLRFCLKQKTLLENKVVNSGSQKENFANLKNAEENNINKQSKNTFRQKINDFQIEALHQYRKSIELLQKNLQKQKNKFDLCDLGEFYLVMDKPNEAVQVFQDAVRLDENFSRSHVGLGVAQSKIENYVEAIKCFKKALMFDPDDLNVQSNLGDVYLKCEKLPFAEDTYKNILQLSPCHLDAMLGLGEYYKLAADKMEEEGKQNEQEEFLQQAIEIYNRIEETNQDFSSSSKKLNSDELASFYYSMGYVNIKLYEIYAGLSFRSFKKIFKESYLKVARKYFLKIKERQPNYYKAQNAINKIQKGTILDERVIAKTAPLLISLLSLVICFSMLFFLWKGRPVKKDVFLIDKTRLQHFIAENRLDSFASQLTDITDKKFNTPKDLSENLAITIRGNDSLINKMKDAVIDKGSLVEFEPIDLMPYALITFGSLIFIVVGLYLSNISKLKFGSIELEKTTSETISTSHNLGISK